MPGTQRQPQRASTPRLARQRLRRFEAGSTNTSYLSVPSAFGLAAVGFDPIGDVLGCIGAQVLHEYVGRCGGRSAPTSVVRTGSGGARYSYLAQLRSLYTTALSRLTAEATALDADGVVDIRLTSHTHGTLREIVAVGTAVRARSRVRPARPFTTDLSGTDVAKLLLGGWTPVSLHVAAQLVVRHDDVLTMTQASPMRGNRVNMEVVGYSDLLTAVNAAAGKVLSSAVSRSGADGCLLSERTMSTWHKHCQVVNAGSDHVALCVLTGSSIARMSGSRQRAPAPLRIMPVGGPT